MIHPDFLPILAYVMTKDTGHIPDNTLYNQLYLGITRDLQEALGVYNYPDALSVVDNCTALLSSMEVPLHYPELIDHTLCFVTSFTIARSMRFIAEQTGNDDLLSLSSHDIPISIPFLVSHSETTSLQAVNYANCRVPLTLDQYKILIEGCHETKIALSRILKVFCLQTPQNPKGQVFLCDRPQGTRYTEFKPFISYTLHYQSNAAKVKKIPGSNDKKNPRKIDYDGVFCQSLSKEAGDIMSYNYQCPAHDCSELLSVLASHCPTYFGFSEQVDGILLPLLEYYSAKKAEAKKILNLIRDDAIATDNKYASLDDLAETMGNRSRTLTESHDALRKIITQLQTLAKNFSNELQPPMSTSRFVPDYVYDSVFTVLFSIQTLGVDHLDAQLRKLKALGYTDLSLVSHYISGIRAQRKSPATAYSAPSLESVDTLVKKIIESSPPHYWEQAMIQLLLREPASLSFAQQKVLIGRIPEKYMSHGKLLYYRALTAPSHRREELLVPSAEAGYSIAMEDLFAIRKLDPSVSNLIPLVSNLHPGACISVGGIFEEMLSKSTSHTPAINNALFYYKLAASVGSLDAIHRIVNLLFERFIKPHISKFGLSPRKNITTYCEQALPLCKYLVDHTYNTEINKSRCGVLLCYLGRNFSGAAKYLSGKTDPLSRFCKGYLYEEGKHYPQNLTTAKNHYLASLLPAAGKRVAYIDRELKKQAEKEARKNSSEAKYSEDDSYEEEYHSTSYSSGPCFITTAACIALQGTDDCPELTLLRRFRDTQLRSNLEGSELVEEYYRLGPIIVEALDSLPNKHNEYMELWNAYIGPSCKLIQDDRLCEARDLYISMVVSLCYRFQIPINTVGFPSLKENLMAQGVPVLEL